MAGTVLEGRVIQTNGNGFKINECPDWLNFSKWAKKEDIYMPSIGAHVKVSCDGSNFVRKVEAVGNGHVAAAAQPEPEHTVPADCKINLTADAKDLRITRLACLNTATAIIAGTTGRANADEVMELAARLESWVLR